MFLEREIFKMTSFFVVGLVLLSSCGGKSDLANSARPDAKISVSVITPQKKTVQGELMLNGIVHTENSVQVVSETQGKVVKVFVDSGSNVSRGDQLVQIDDEQKMMSYKAAQASYDKNKADWDRAESLFKQNVISESDRQGVKLAFVNADSQLFNAKRDFDNAKVRSPQNGVVTKRFVSVGSMLSPGAPVANIVDITNLKMTVQVGEKDVLKIRPGFKVTVESDLYPGVVFPGVVSSITPQGDSSLSFPVDIAITTDSKKTLYDGMSAKAHLKLGARTISAIPRVALVGSYQNAQVYVVKNGIAKLVTIKIGGEYDTDLEVVSGLSGNEQVVTDGQNNLNDGTPVLIVGKGN